MGSLPLVVCCDVTSSLKHKTTITRDSITQSYYSHLVGCAGFPSGKYILPFPPLRRWLLELPRRRSASPNIVPGRAHTPGRVSGQIFSLDLDPAHSQIYFYTRPERAAVESSADFDHVTNTVYNCRVRSVKDEHVQKNFTPKTCTYEHLAVPISAYRYLSDFVKQTPSGVWLMVDSRTHPS
ncbi:hypothetical protein RRG08_039979 [Elysia crispata]|uniref:Uncharacterized protein n=1 Tax=Elysia crispata TaxID=231223 RepID=A0AAE1DCH9_9GAST|nr:hypothetical protein RRG08_039979 [Elysia crispata]